MSVFDPQQTFEQESVMGCSAELGSGQLRIWIAYCLVMVASRLALTLDTLAKLFADRASQVARLPRDALCILSDL
jgi:hypothetical protein